MQQMLILLDRNFIYLFMQLELLALQSPSLATFYLYTSAPNCRREADFHVCPERILASAGAKLEWQESGSKEAREYIKKIPFVLRP